MTANSASAFPRRPSPGEAGARLAALYDEHARMVYGVCRLILRDADEAEDAAQQVFLSAYRSLLAGTEPRNAGAWLGTIARNEARGRIATSRLRPVGLDDGRVAGGITLEEQADARAELAELHAQIAALPEKQREAVILRDLYGLRYDEVARALRTSRPAVEALLFRGRRRLQRKLRPDVAAGVLVVPLALRDSLAYAVPGFAEAAATTGLLAKLAAVPVAAKLAAAGATVGVAGSAGLVADRALTDAPPKPPTPVTAPAQEGDLPHARQVSIRIDADARRTLPALAAAAAGAPPARPADDDEPADGRGSDVRDERAREVDEEEREDGREELEPREDDTEDEPEEEAARVPDPDHEDTEDEDTEDEDVEVERPEPVAVADEHDDATRDGDEE